MATRSLFENDQHAERIDEQWPPMIDAELALNLDEKRENRQLPNYYSFVQEVDINTELELETRVRTLAT